MLVDMLGAPVTDDTELGRWMIEFATRFRHDIDEIYVRLDDEQTEQQPMAGRLNMLYRDRHAHAHASDLARSKVMSLCTTVLGQQTFIEALKLLKRLQTQMTEFESQQGPAKGLTQSDAPEEAGSSS
ncbi:hypothetical protein Tco_1234396 [Tanacetum coccineum]